MPSPACPVGCHSLRAFNVTGGLFPAEVRSLSRIFLTMISLTHAIPSPRDPWSMPPLAHATLG